MEEARPTRLRKKDNIEAFIGSPQIFQENSLSQLRYMILTEGLQTPPDYDTCPYRLYVWLILLNVPLLPVDDYAELVLSARALSAEIYTKITNDTFRTLKTEEVFHKKVANSLLTRILLCIAVTIRESVGYVQGLNVLLAPIIYVCHRSEPQAYSLLHTLVERHIPLYITPNLDGVHTGCALIEVVLRMIDPNLASFFDSKFLKTEIYALPSVLTLCACTPPLREVLRLWDFLFAYGTHMNILFVVAQLVSARSALLKSEQPMKILRNFPALEALEIIKLSLSFIPELPVELYDMITRHGYDPEVNAQLKRFIHDSSHLK